MGTISAHTSFLYANPSFLGGMASALDIGRTLATFNESATPAEADLKAMANDWKAVGKDLENSILEYGQKQK